MIKVAGIPGKRSSLLWTLAGIAFLLLLWEIAARVYGSGLLLPGPIPVIKRLLALFNSRRFLFALTGSFVRVIAGIAIAVPLGIAVGIAAGLDKRVKFFVKPLFSVISATPVMSVILIAFLFLGAGKTPVFTAFLMIFPIMAANTIEGIVSTDTRLKELFAVFRMSFKDTLKYLYIPSLVPFILGGLKSSLSMCWKVVVAAEVLVQPMLSLGTGMQQAKAQLETTELFAWTAATVIAAALCQSLLSLSLKKWGKHK